MSDKMREEFEAWQIDKYCGGSDRLRRCSNDGSTYYFTDVQLKWKVWQASREALVIELPKFKMMIHLDSQGYMRAQCRNAIEAAGVKVKP